jgi:WD40 repeat protein
MGGKALRGALAAVCVVACGFLVVVAGRGLDKATSWAAVIGAIAGVAGAGAAVWPLLPRRPAAGKATPIDIPWDEAAYRPQELEVPAWVVGRPAELAEVTAALGEGRGGVVGITTGLFGAGGFGKTTLAKMACADSQVRETFSGGVYLVTVGRDLRGQAAIAGKVNDVIKLVTGQDATFTDPQMAGLRLGMLLDEGPLRLLVLDDVWEPAQLAPFTQGGRRCARLVTTRIPELLAGHGTAVLVDQMTPEQAQVLLTRDLPFLEEKVIQGLLDVTGRWPLLLRLVNKILADHSRLAPQADVSVQATALLDRLRANGPAIVDHLTGSAVHRLDVNNPDERAQAVRATIEASTSLLNREDAERFAELGIFAEDEAIPFPYLAKLWHATAGMIDVEASQTCMRLAHLALISQPRPDSRITIHDVIRDYLRAELGTERLASLNALLVDAVAERLPSETGLDSTLMGQPQKAWWELGDEDRYLWDHLIEHLVDAGRPADANLIACDLRWAGARLQRFGPAAPAADLAAAGTSQANRLRIALNQTAHLLAPTQPPGAVIDIFHSRLASDSDWGKQIATLRDQYPCPRLLARSRLPDLAHSALRRTLTGHDGGVFAVAVSPDSTWLVTGGQDGTARVWDTVTGRERMVLTGHDGGVSAVAVSPDSRWLATGDSRGTVRIWDSVNGQRQADFLTGHVGGVSALAVSPDGSWIVTGGVFDGKAEIWEPSTGTHRAVLAADHGAVHAAAIAADGSWLATAGHDGRVRIWDCASGEQRAVFTGSRAAVSGVAIAADGSWLAAGGYDGTVRIWDCASGEQRAVLTGNNAAVSGVAIAADASWLATAGHDGTARIWDSSNTEQRSAFAGNNTPVSAVLGASDGTWLAAATEGKLQIWDVAKGRARGVIQYPGSVSAMASCANDSLLAVLWGLRDRVHILDTATGRESFVLSGQRDVSALAAAPDGMCIATGDDGGRIHIWDAATGRERAAFDAHDGAVTTLAVAPGGTWLATSGLDGALRIWDTSGQQSAALPGDYGRDSSVAIASNGAWLVTARKSESAVRIWFAATGELYATLRGHHGEVSSVAITPDAAWIAIASKWDGTVRIWDTATGKISAQMRLESRVNSAAWLGLGALALGGSAGLFLFDFITDSLAGSNSVQPRAGYVNTTPPEYLFD